MSITSKLFECLNVQMPVECTCCPRPSWPLVAVSIGPLSPLDQVRSSSTVHPLNCSQSNEISDLLHFDARVQFYTSILDFDSRPRCYTSVPCAEGPGSSRLDLLVEFPQSTSTLQNPACSRFIEEPACRLLSQKF